MKALTICQPYARLIVDREKLVENRTWYTPYRGPLLIHAGKSKQWLDGEDILYKRKGDPLQFGAIVGVAKLLDCIRIERIQTGLLDHKYPWIRGHEHTLGPWCWVVDLIGRCKPVSINGKLGLWDAPVKMKDLEWV